MRPEGWDGVRRVLAVRLDNVGDAVLLGPALRALRHALPEARITLMASPAAAQVAPMLPWIDEVIMHSAVWQDASGRMPLDPERERGLIDDLVERAFDAALIFTSFSQSPWPPAYACYLAGIPRRIGQSKEFGGSVLTQWVRPLPDATHQAERNLHLLEAAGFHVGRRDLELRVPEGARARADALLAARRIATHAPFVLLAPGASCAARTYDPGRFAAAMRAIVERTGLPVVIAASERERGMAAQIASMLEGARVATLAGETSVPELAALIQRAALLVANDSGPMHIADALRRPMVITYSGTEHESQWAPRSAPAVLLRRETGCSPCYAFRCPYGMECLDIPPGEVAGAAVRMLATGSVLAAEEVRA
ncbi:MAG TPA: glycosyltransferase family 9 protein [Dehalococcoidia bacterium]|nr:glycosyltransferase family 9 protein [Dehalococcoidia bacterium]